MGCGCRKAARAGSRTAGGKTVIGFEVSYPESTGRAPEMYLSLAEARAALRTAGAGGTIVTKTA